MRRSIFVTLAVCLCGFPALAAAQDVYISVGPEIRKLTLGNKGNNIVVAGNTPVYTSAQAFIGDLALCSDNNLYFVEKTTPLNLVRRLTLGSTTPQTVFTAADVGEIRLTKTCDVTYATAATANGVALVDTDGKPPISNPATPPAGSGEGLAFAFNGDYVSSPGSLTVNVANGGVGSASGMQTPNDLPTGARCTAAEGANTVVCTNKALNVSIPLATFPALDKVQYCEFFTNDIMVCAASVDPTAEIRIDKQAGIVHNGSLKLITAPGAVSQIFEASTQGNRALPVVGVAVGPSSSAVFTSASANTHHADFGPVIFDVFLQNGASCAMTFQLRQLTLAQAQAKLTAASKASQNTTSAYVVDPGSGGESWLDDVDVTASGNCGPSPRVLISQFNDFAPSKAVIHCHGTQCKAITEGNFPYSTPDDDGNSGLPDNFSDFLTAAVSTANKAVVFSTPLQSAPVVQGEIDSELSQAIPTFNATGGLSMRFRICATTTNCTSFSAPEPPNVPPSAPPFTGAGLSVTRLVLDDANAIVGRVNCDVDDNGGANPDRPVFRIAGDAHVFNLNTPLSGNANACGLADLDNGEKALFAFTVFSHSGKFNKTTILAFLQK